MDDTFFPEEWWAELQGRRSLAMLDRMWIEDGYFCREPYLPRMRFAFTNYGVSVGLQVVDGATFAKTFGDQAVQNALDLKASSNDRIMFNGVKFFSDDVFVSLGMQVQNPGYIHSDKYKGLFLRHSRYRHDPRRPGNHDLRYTQAVTLGG